MFKYTFQITRKIIFDVRYDDLDGANKEPSFSTSAAVFNQPKTDFEHCGQCQKDVLPVGLARDFFEKWDYKHLCHLTEQEEKEVLQDIEKLKEKYNWIDSQSFYAQKNLSIMKLKK